MLKKLVIIAWNAGAQNYARKFHNSCKVSDLCRVKNVMCTYELFFFLKFVAITAENKIKKIGLKVLNSVPSE